MRGKERIIRIMEAGRLPQDALFDSARVMLSGRTRVTVEGQHGVVELSAQRIRLKTGEGMLLVAGRGLVLSELTPEKAIISGEAIETLCYQ